MPKIVTPLNDSGLKERIKRSVQEIASGAKSVVKIGDGFGLKLVVKGTGSPTWVFEFEGPDGKARKLTIGPYPTVGLADARKRREEARALLAQGIDPAKRKVEEREAARAADAAAKYTFAAAAADLLAKKRADGKASATIGKREWLYSLPGDEFGNRPLVEITTNEVREVLQAIEAKGMHETARRLRSCMSEVFRYAKFNGKAVDDPVAAVKGFLTPPKVKHRAAITDAARFGELLRAIDGFQGQLTTRAALQLMALLFPRPGELRLAKWGEFDLDGAVWRVPAERMKQRIPHMAPLPRQAVEILRHLHLYTGTEPFVFPAIGPRGRPMSENTLNGALRRLGFLPEEMVAHGFRASASTLLNESNRWSVDAIERALAHVDENEIRRTYDRGARWAERVAMSEWWADYLDVLRVGGNVVPITAARRA